MDWGTREGLTPIDAVIRFGSAPDATQAAMWLCQRMGIEPARLGWKGAFGSKDSYPPPPFSATETASETASDRPAPMPLPAGLLPVARFDYDMLPERLRSRVEDIAERMQCPPDLVAAPMMAALGSLVGRKVCVRPKKQDDWSVVPNQWNLNIAPSGFMKTPAYNEALRPIRALEAKARDEFKQAKRDHASEVKAIEAATELREKSAKEEAKKALEKNKDANIKDLLKQKAMEVPEAPVQRRYISINTSAEALGEILKGNPNGVIFARDEMMALLHTLDEEGQSTAREFYMLGWDGDTDYNFDRIGRGADNYIPAVCLSAIGGTQPERIAQYVDEVRRGNRGNDGLIQRFGLLVWPDTDAGWVDIDRHPNAMARDMAKQVFEKLDDLDSKAIGARQDKIGDAAVGLPYLRLSAEAQAEFSIWRATLERRIRGGDPDLDPMMASHLAKYRKLVPALALIIHLVDRDTSKPAGDVSLYAMQKALRWAAYLETHAARVYGSGNTAVVAAAQAIMAKIKSKQLKAEGFSSRDVWRPGWSKLKSSDVANAALQLLVNYDWLSATKVPQTGGRMATVYVANPKALVA
jgi:putative DNA primase/helicase